MAVASFVASAAAAAAALAAVASVRFRNRVRWRRPFTAARWRRFWTLLAVVCTGVAAFLLPLPFFRRVRCFLSFEPSGRPGFRFWGRSPDCITPRWLKQAPGAVCGQRGGQAMSSERHGQDKGG